MERYILILENDGTPSPLKPVYENPGDYPMLQYLGDIDGARIYFIPVDLIAGRYG